MDTKKDAVLMAPHPVNFKIQIPEFKLFFEVTVVKSLETRTVTSLVFSHFVNSVVDCVKTKFLSLLSNIHLPDFDSLRIQWL